MSPSGPGEAPKPSKKRITTITISTPTLILGVLVVLWFTNNLDGLLSQLGVPRLTHACVADNTVGNVVRCALYRAQNIEANHSDPASSPAQPPAGTGTAQAQVSTNSSDYPSPCTLYLDGHDAQLTIAGANAPSDCASFATSEASNGQTWTTGPAGSSSSLSQVCDLANAGDEIIVNDDGARSYGTQACNSLTGQGWTSTSTSTSTSTTSQSAPPVGNYCPPGTPPSSTPTFPSGDPCLLRPLPANAAHPGVGKTDVTPGATVPDTSACSEPGAMAPSCNVNGWNDGRCTVRDCPNGNGICQNGTTATYSDTKRLYVCDDATKP